MAVAASTEIADRESPAPAGAGRIGARVRAFAGARELSRGELLDARVRWPRPARLAEPLELPKGKLADGMHALGLHTVGDLLEHLPRDSREARTVAELRAGEQATVAVQVRAIAARPVRRRGMRPLVEASVFDATGTMRATFFNQPWLVERYPPGTRLLLHGKADARGGFRVSHHAPEAQLALGEAAARCERSRLAGAGASATRCAADRRRRPHARAPGALGRALPGDRGRQLDADPHARAGRARGARRRRRAAAGSRARRASGCPTAPARSPRCTSRASTTTPSAGASGWRSRSCCSRSSRSCAAARAVARAQDATRAAPSRRR